jgi:hypothetical protein
MSAALISDKTYHNAFADLNTSHYALAYSDTAGTSGQRQTAQMDLKKRLRKTEASTVV